MERKYIERPGVLTEGEARPILQPHLPNLIDDFHESWDWVQAVLDQDSERRITFDNSTQAAMIFNRFVVLIGRRMEGHDDVQVRKYGRMMRALIGNRRLALRFKKLTKKRDGHLCSGNVKTNAQGKIYYQLGFDGMGSAKPTEITFGYTTDEANSSVTGIYVTCPVSWYSNKWVMVLEGGEGELSLPYATPSGPTPPEPSEAIIIITPKTKKESNKG